MGVIISYEVILCLNPPQKKRNSIFCITQGNFVHLPAQIAKELSAATSLLRLTCDAVIELGTTFFFEIRDGEMERLGKISKVRVLIGQ